MPKTSLVLGAAVLALLAGCAQPPPSDAQGAASCGTHRTPTSVVYVCNRTDSFLFAYSASSYTDTKQYRWTNTQGDAVVQHTVTVTAGVVRVLVKDASGQQVFARDFVGSGSEGTAQTSPGSPGAWSIDVAFATAEAAVVVAANAY